MFASLSVAGVTAPHAPISDAVSHISDPSTRDTAVPPEKSFESSFYKRDEEAEAERERMRKRKRKGEGEGGRGRGKGKGEGEGRGRGRGRGKGKGKGKG
jgi:hypothetical protein